MTVEPSIYRGSIRHRRLTPVRHEFEYPIFMAFLDIDRIEELMSISPFTSFNRFNWASWNDRDHFGDPRLAMRARLEDDARSAGIVLPPGRIFLLTHLRYLGYNFNPVSFFYCFDEGGGLGAVMAEVNNTFGERHNYWLLPPGPVGKGESCRVRAVKEMHVSPFLKMDLDYTFDLSVPNDQLRVHMSTADESGTMFHASLELNRERWDRSSILRALVAHPFMTAKVVLAIHWEALKLLIKKAPVFSHPKGLGWKI